MVVLTRCGETTRGDNPGPTRKRVMDVFRVLRDGRERGTRPDLGLWIPDACWMVAEANFFPVSRVWSKMAQVLHIFTYLHLHIFVRPRSRYTLFLSLQLHASCCGQL